MKPTRLGQSRRWTAILLGVLGAFVVPPGGTVSADGAKPDVVLTLETVTAERDEGTTRFECRATLENRTGADLKVRSAFSSPFDGLTLVVRDEGGKELRKQPYVFHQSPMAEDREYPLPVGKTTTKLVFPVGELPKDAKKFKVQLVGALPGSGYEPGLSSAALEVAVKAP